jgi:hypothetical protein
MNLQQIHIQQTLLQQGQYAAALEQFDSYNSHNDLIFRDYGIPRWKGQSDINNLRLLIVHQWGLGDCVMALRYLQKLRCAELALCVPPALFRLAKTLGVPVYSATVPIELFDTYCPIMRLIGYLPGIPKPPYLKVDPAWIAEAKQMTNGKRRIGIAWRGNPKHVRDATRSIPLDKFLELLPYRNVAYYSLQNAEQEAARVQGIIAPDYQDLAEVAAMASLMDDIVVVDTAAANLVGAMGLSARVLLDYDYDWRWRRGDEWYPTLTRCIQSQAGDWESAFAQIE